MTHPLDADAIRREQLEEHIPETLDLIKEYEDLRRTSDDPMEIERCKKKLLDLREQLREYQQEYAALTGAGNAAGTPRSGPAQFPEGQVATWPHPVALAALAYNQAGDETSRFMALDSLLLSAVKVLAAIGLAQYRHDHPRSPHLRPWLNRLSRHHLSEWAALLAELEAHYRQNLAERPPLMGRLFDAYSRPAPIDSPISRANREIADRMQQDPGRHNLTLGAFIERLVTYRERTWEAGQLHLLPPGFITNLTALLQPALRQLLGGFDLLSDYSLRYVDSVRQRGGAWVYELANWRGPGLQPNRAGEYRASGARPPRKARRLYLCAPDGQPLLNLHPLLIHHRDHLYFLEAMVEDEQLAFRPCHSGPILTIPSDLQSSLLSIFKSLGDSSDEPEADTGEVLDEIEEKVDTLNTPPPPETLPEVLDYLLDDGREALEYALGESLRIGRFWLGVEFLLMGLSRQPRGIFFVLLREIGLHPGELRGVLRGLAGVTEAKNDRWRNQNVGELGREMLPRLRQADPAQLRQMEPVEEPPEPVITPRMMAVLNDAVRLADGGRVGATDLLTAALKNSRSIAVQLFFNVVYQAGWSPEQVLKRVDQLAGLPPEELAVQTPPVPPARPPRPDRTGMTPRSPRGGSVTGQLGRDLTQAAADGRLHPAAGESARKAIAQIGRILLQREANNPILVGDPGVGKTAVVEGFAWRLLDQERPVVKQLAGRRIIELSANALTSGTKYRGDLEERLKQLLAEVKTADGQTIIFIDEIHNILKSGGNESIAEALKPALARGEFPCIGATTVAEYRQYIEKDAALARRFTAIWLDEPTIKEAIAIVGSVAQGHLAEHHQVGFDPAAIKAAVRLSARYLHDERLPGKAIKVLDEAASGLIVPGTLFAGDEAEPLSRVGGTVTVEDVLEIISGRTNIPVSQLGKTDKQRLLDVEGRLKKRIIGQDEAIAQVVRVVKRAGAGLSDPRRPQGVFLFAGPTGVGKTELALALAAALFDQEDAIFRLDMSEFMEKHQVARLTGAPPGYVGYDDEGQLTGRLRRYPYSVILLDEIEKAHPDVQHLFLQLFDNGRLTDSQGRLADGRNAIFIMTTNLGAKEALGLAAASKSYKEKLLAAIHDHFTLEFINRIDRIVYFNPLDEAALFAIFGRELEPFQDKLKREQGITITIPDDVKYQVARQIMQQKLGARPLRRFIEDQIIAPLVDQLLAGDIKPGSSVTLGSEFDFSSGAVSPPPAAAEDKPLFNPGQVNLSGVDASAKLPPQPGRPVRPKDGLPHNPRIPDKEQTEFDSCFLPLARRLADQGIAIEIDSIAKFWLCVPHAADQKPREGRSIRQAFDELITDRLSEKLTAEEYQSGDWLKIDFNHADNSIEIRKVVAE